MSNQQVQLVAQDIMGADNNLPSWVCNFINIYQQLTTGNLHLLANIYDENIVFEDPMHKVEGFENLKQYFEQLYQNLTSCTFAINQVIANDDNAAVYWTMSYVHPKLNGAKLVEVQGTSKIKRLGNKVIHHQDYLDIGAMLYEQIPVVGSMIKMIKKRAIK